MNTKISIDHEKIAEFCQRWKITEFSIFGSALRDDFQPYSSDIDVLVSFSKDAHWTLLDWVDMENDLKSFFGREVDLVSRRGIERSRNYLRRKAILESAKVIYAAS